MERSPHDRREDPEPSDQADDHDRDELDRAMADEVYQPPADPMADG
jgi:hypothetical protein